MGLFQRNKDPLKKRAKSVQNKLNELQAQIQELDEIPTQKSSKLHGEESLFSFLGVHFVWQYSELRWIIVFLAGISTNARVLNAETCAGKPL